MKLRVRYRDMPFTRNPWPARGPNVLSLDELRRYIRLFWLDPEYGLSEVRGAYQVFRRKCQLDTTYFRRLFLMQPPEMEYLSQSRQRLCSKAVLDVLTGRIHYEENPHNLCRAVAVYDPHGTPPGGIAAMKRDIPFSVRFERFGPRLHRLPI